MARAVLLLGGNLGPVAQHLLQVRALLPERVGREVAHSSVWESQAWGFQAEERFLNQVVVVETELAPEALLDAIQQIEREMGRIRHHPAQGYTSRTMDIDILFYDDLILQSERLTIPHPLLAQRAFVLNPLEEILPDLHHPVLHKTIRELRNELVSVSTQEP